MISFANYVRSCEYSVTCLSSLTWDRLFQKILLPTMFFLRERSDYWKHRHDDNVQVVEKAKRATDSREHLKHDVALLWMAEEVILLFFFANDVHNFRHLRNNFFFSYSARTSKETFIEKSSLMPFWKKTKSLTWTNIKKHFWNYRSQFTWKENFWQRTKIKLTNGWRLWSLPKMNKKKYDLIRAIISISTNPSILSRKIFI